jgi:formylglycine-generating enzyme required for sulfatase activity
MPHIFISYAKKDTRLQAESLFRLLNDIPSITAWMDQSLEADNSWALQIQNEIDNADYVVVLLSPDVNRQVTPTQRRSFVLNEIDYAQQDNKPILPVMVHQTKMPVQIAGDQYIDLTSTPNDVKKIVERITRRFNIETIEASYQREQSEQRQREANELRQKQEAEQRQREADKLHEKQETEHVKVTTTPQPQTKQSRSYQIHERKRHIGYYPLYLIVILVGIIFVILLVYLLRDGNASTSLSPSQMTQVIQQAQTPITRNEDWTPIENNFDGVAMMLVPAGCFMMGSERNTDEIPIHEQCIHTPFWIDKYEVSQGQFQRLGGIQEQNTPYFIGDNLPVERITWFEAQNFCTLRGGRLPTEVEWEYAARGPDNWVYPWGNTFIAENVMNTSEQTSPIGSYPTGISWIGALDQTGNVWEWTSSLYQPYQVDNRQESDTTVDLTTLVVLRGGSFLNPQTTTTTRYRGAPDYDSFNFIGFRCVRPSS